MQINSTDARVQQMFSLLVDSSASDSDREKVKKKKEEKTVFCWVCLHHNNTGLL